MGNFNEIVSSLSKKAASRKDYLGEVVKILHDFSQCRCVGVRVLDSHGNAPYESYIGFSKSFWKSENFISLNDNCACTRVIKGDKIYSTGSFQSNDYVNFMNGLTAEEKSEFRGACKDMGFKSIAIIPIYQNNKILGAIHLADERENCVPNDVVIIIQEIAPVVGEGIKKFDLLDRIREKEHELIKSKRLSDMGTLAGFLAHEIRNPLAVIKVATYNLKKKNSNPDLLRHIENIEKNVIEGEQIITNLVNFAQLKLPIFKKINLLNLLDECVASAEEKYSDFDVFIQKKYEPIYDSLEVDAFQIKEVFKNLLDNAYQSMTDKKGHIELSTKIVEKGYVDVIFKDTGSGIEKHNLDRIFTPFFTTKAHGTGLGLSICSELVHLNNGFIFVDSEKNKGSKFTVRLPIQEKNHL